MLAASPPDCDAGRHRTARLGFILMSTDLAAEADLHAMAPDDVGIHVTRLRTDDNTNCETLSRHAGQLAEAASRIQPEARPEVICYSCTSGSIVIGEDRVFEEIRKGAPWAHPMCIATAVVDALNELGVRRVVVGTPYVDEINRKEAEFLIDKGFDLLDMRGLNLETGLEFGQVTPDYWKRFAMAINRPDADAIFLSCSGIRALEVVEEVEEATGKPVITSNQAQFWSCLRRAGAGKPIRGFGRLPGCRGASLLPVPVTRSP